MHRAISHLLAGAARQAGGGHRPGRGRDEVGGPIGRVRIDQGPLSDMGLCVGATTSLRVS